MLDSAVLRVRLPFYKGSLILKEVNSKGNVEDGLTAVTSDEITTKAKAKGARVETTLAHSRWLGAGNSKQQRQRQQHQGQKRHLPILDGSVLETRKLGKAKGNNKRHKGANYGTLGTQGKCLMGKTTLSILRGWWATQGTLLDYPTRLSLRWVRVN